MALVHVLSDLEDFGDERPWADFIFDITQLKCARDDGGAIEHIEFEMRADHETGEVGLKVHVPVQDWSGSLDSEFPIFGGFVTLRSVGSQTDRLVRLFEAWWDLPGDSASAPLSLTAVAVGLGTDPRMADREPVRLKLFFDPDHTQGGEGGAVPDPGFGVARSLSILSDVVEADEEDLEEEEEELENPGEAADYAELYLNFDLAARRAWLKEKDEGYRKAVVSWLTGRIRRADESVQ
jgi:hypothetical protein